MRDFTVAKRGDMNTVAVLVAQRLLTKFELGDAKLKKIDGQYGATTEAAVRRFHRDYMNIPNGQARVGRKTFAALGLNPLTPDHLVRLHAQQKPGRCWAAAAAMMLGGREPGPGQGQIDKRGALLANEANVKAFAQGLGWTVLPVTRTYQGFVPGLKVAPLWLGGEALNSLGHVDAIHAVAVGGMFSYEWGKSPNNTEVILKIFDPWPLGQGRSYFMEWPKLILPGGRIFYARWALAPPRWTP